MIWKLRIYFVLSRDKYVAMYGYSMEQEIYNLMLYILCILLYMQFI
jgi:hypothetical protein